MTILSKPWGKNTGRISPEAFIKEVTQEGFQIDTWSQEGLPGISLVQTLTDEAKPTSRRKLEGKAQRVLKRVPQLSNYPPEIEHYGIAQISVSLKFVETGFHREMLRLLGKDPFGGPGEEAVRIARLNLDFDQKIKEEAEADPGVVEIDMAIKAAQTQAERLGEERAAKVLALQKGKEVFRDTYLEVVDEREL